jgi:copper homeostasis protein
VTEGDLEVLEMVRLEIIATSLADAIAAEQGGADSVEVCVDLALDGLTPPLDMVKAIREAVHIDMHVMLRPHNNGFVYGEREVATMLAQVDLFRPLGIQSLVFGAHRKDGALDVDLIRRIAQAAAPLPLTVHRALERSSNPEDALHRLVGVAARILTSGPAASAAEGRAGLRRWVQAFGAHYRFAAAGGICLENARDIMLFTGAHECHVGTAARTDDAVDPHKVRLLRAAIQP